MTTKGGANRPRVTLKLATSLDARIATRTGASQWITGPIARQEVHRMRAKHDGIITGIGTILADDPLLTARTDPVCLDQPVRIVMDSQARLPLASKLARSGGQGRIIWCTGAQAEVDAAALPQGMIHQPFGGSGRPDPVKVLELLWQYYGLKTLMIEAGPTVGTSFLRAGLVDTIAWFRAPLVLGGDGKAVFDSLGVDGLDQASHFDLQERYMFGRDSLEIYRVLPG